MQPLGIRTPPLRGPDQLRDPIGLPWRQQMNAARSCNGWPGVLALLNQSLHAWRLRDAGRDASWTLLAAGVAARYIGGYRVSAKLFHISGQQAQRAGSERPAAWAAAEYAELLRITGAPGASAALQESRRRFYEIRDISGVAWAEGALGKTFLAAENVRQADHAFAAAAAAASATDSSHALGWALRGQAETAMTRGMYDTCAERLDESAEAFTQARYTTGRAYVERSRSRLALSLGHPGTALVTARRSVQLFATGGERRGVLYGRLTLAEAQHAAGDEGAAARAWAAYRDLIRHGANVPPAHRPGLGR